MLETGHLILFISVFIAISEASVNVCQLPTNRRQRLNISCDFNYIDGCTSMYRRTLSQWKYKTGRFAEIWNAEISGDHSRDGLGGYYLFDSRSFSGKDRLLMPMINYSNICLTFWYNLATVASNINVTANAREIFHNTGKSHGWSKSVIPFNSGSNTPVQIEFEGKKQYVHDIVVVGIDDITIEIEKHPTAMPLEEAATVVNTPKHNSLISLTTSSATTTPTTANPTIAHSSTATTVPFMKTTETLMPEAIKQKTSSTSVTLKAMPTAKSSTTADIPTTTPQIITLMALITSTTTVIPTSKPVTTRPKTIIPTVLTTITATTSSTAITATSTLTANTDTTSSMATNPAITPETTTPWTLYATSTHTATVTTTTPMSPTSITPLTTPTSTMPNLYKIATKSTPTGWRSTWIRSEYTEATPHREETIGQPHKNGDESKQGKSHDRSSSRDIELHFAFSFLLRERFD